MTIVVVVRPGWTEFDEQHRVVGSLDLLLNSRGEEQVLWLISRLREFAPEVVLCGTGQPAKATAAAIGEVLGIKARESKDFNNLNQGLWQGLSIQEIRRKMPRIFKQWQEAPETICPPEGEPWEVAVKRVQKALKKPLRKYASLALVASEPLASLVCSVLSGEPPDLSAAFPEVPGDPIIDILESTGSDGHFERRSEPPPKRSIESPTPAPASR
jgi:broad specificity phosphatase PhoE